MNNRVLSLAPALVVAGLIAALLTSALGALFWHSPLPDLSSLLGDRYLHRVLRFSLYQALLSTLLSLAGGLLLARFFYHCNVPGRRLLLRLFDLCLVIPSIVVIMGIVSVHGRQGWVNQTLNLLGFDSGNYLYGLNGILLAHLLFNIPLATRLLLGALEQVPQNQWRLAAQLGFNRWQALRHLEWPRLRQRLGATASLIFLLCFTSFAVVLTLGGGPRATTLEVAIYQALRFDFDPGRAAWLALLQLGICLLLTSLLPIHSRLRVNPTSAHPQPDTFLPKRALSPLWNLLPTLVIILLVLLPLLAALLAGLNHRLVSVLNEPALWQAIGTSLALAIGAACVAALLCAALLLGLREALVRQPNTRQAWVLQSAGNLILMLPAMVIGSGLFLLSFRWIAPAQSGFYWVMLVNSLTALPFMLRLLLPPTLELCQQYDRLALSLGLTGWNRWRLLEWPQLRRPIGQALGLALLLSLGDFGVIALFGSERFSTLPLYLYRLLGSYRVDEAAAVALILILLCLSLFSLCARLIGGAKASWSPHV